MLSELLGISPSEMKSISSALNAASSDIRKLRESCDKLNSIDCKLGQLLSELRSTNLAIAGLKNAVSCLKCD